PSRTRRPRRGGRAPPRDRRPPSPSRTRRPGPTSSPAAAPARARPVPRPPASRRDSRTATGYDRPRPGDAGGPEIQGHGPEQRSAYARAKLRAEALQARSKALADRAQDERSRHASVDALFEMVDRDGELGGGIIAGALAYRLFIWLLPLALVAVAGLGLAADASSKSPEEAAKSLGLEGLISNSIANAANSPNRWYALVIGIPVLIWEQNHYWSANFPDSTRR